MNNDNSKFKDEKIEVLVENNVQTIYDHLNDLEKESKVYAKRWFWELLQNAKDAVNEDQKVSVKVSLDDHTLSFSHTGNAFKNQDVLHLIYHGSSKKSLENKTGRFGTGFMSTHLLSRQVNITGKLDDGRYFDFKLDRSGEDITGQMENLEKSYQRFCDSYSEVNRGDGNFDTIFTYILPPENLHIANMGLDQLEKILPFVMAFNSKIADIEISRNGSSTTIKRGSTSEESYEGHTIIEQSVESDTFHNKVLFISKEGLEVAVLLEKDTDEKYSVVHLDDAYPKLFFDFPLFGTEKLGFPAVMNSNQFDLKKERDGIYLLEDDKGKPTIINNKKLIVEGLSAIETMLKFTASKSYEHTFNLFRAKRSFEYSWLHLDWINELTSGFIDTIIEEKCLNIGQSEKNALSSFFIPWSAELNRAELYQLVKGLKPGYMPDWEESQEWIDITAEYATLQVKSVTEFTHIVDEEKICVLLERAATFDNVIALVNSGEEGSADIQTPSSEDINGSTTAELHHTRTIEWYNKFLALLTKELTEKLSALYKFIPNQCNELIKREFNSPYIDEIGNVEIKTVAQNLKWPLRSTLILPGIKPQKEIFLNSTLEKVLAILSTKAESLTEEQLNEDSNRLALIKFSKWLIENKRIDLLGDSMVIIENAREAGKFTYSKRRLSQSTSDKLIAPVSLWPNLSLYAEVLPKKYLLIDQYAEILTTQDFEYLATSDLIFLGPLLRKSSPGKVDLKALTKDKNDYGKLLNDKEEVIANDMVYSDIAYLNRTDDNVLAKTADSIKSAKALLNFLLSQAIVEDELFNTTTKLNTGLAEVNMCQCLWIARLRESQWVPYRPLEEDKTTSERPSVANIAELLKGNEELGTKMKVRQAGLFFNQIGISIADIRRNSLSSDEDKLNWDMTFSALIGNGNINPEMAIEMLSDPRLQEVYIAQKKQKENIKNNQSIGFDFEKIFRQIFEQQAYKQQGFTIKRVPVGSDFGLIYEQDIIDENGNEVMFSINNNVLIELKATAKTFAEMTEKQAEKANEHIKNYVLAVLPLSGYEINEINVIENVRFVVDVAKPLARRFEDFKSYKKKKDETTTEKVDVRLSIEDGSTRYQVKSEIWEKSETPLEDMLPSLSFTEFLEWIIQNREIPPMKLP